MYTSAHLNFSQQHCNGSTLTSNNDMMSSSMKRSSDAVVDEGIDPQNQILDIPNNLETRIKFISQELLRVVQKLCQESRKVKGVPDPAVEPSKTLLPRLERFMRWLESNVDITPELRTRSKIDQGLQLMFNRPEFHFQENTKERARLLYMRWDSQNWGKGQVGEDSTEDEADATVKDEDTSSAKRRKLSTDAPARRDSKTDIVASTVRAPPPNDPIFGTNGIMHGVALKIGPRRKDYILDSRYQKRDAKVYGDNGLKPGDWWPMQVVALCHGAHGSKMGGISGNSEFGAYSIVTAGGQYEELDQDHGNILYYSGSGSHENTDPKNPAPSTTATSALQASLRTQNPVRVLRAAGAGSGKSKKSWRPTVGIRYDGLYRVVATALRTNVKGGLYEQFKLERIEGQPPLDTKSRPTAGEIRDYEKRDQGY